MIRGTTPTLSFKLPFSAEEISEIWITIAQNKIPVLTKSKGDITIDEEDDTIVSFKMSQVETLKMNPNYAAQLQIRIKMAADNNAIASEILEVPVSNILKDGII